MYFSYLEQKYNIGRQIKHSQVKFIDRDLLFDLYNILFKEHVEVMTVPESGLSPNERVAHSIVNRILESSFLKTIKKHTALNEQNSFLFITTLLNSLDNISMWEDEGFDDTEELLSSMDKLNNSTSNDKLPGDNKPSPGGLLPGSTKGSAGQKLKDDYNNISNMFSEFVDKNSDWLHNLNQPGTLAAPDRIKSINLLYDINRLAEGFGKLKEKMKKIEEKGDDSTGPKLTANIDKQLNHLSKHAGNSKMAVDEIDRLLRHTGRQVEKDLLKRQELYNSLKKISSYGYWDLTLGNLVQSNPEFCFYLAGIIQKHPEILKLIKITGNLKKIRTRKQKKLVRSSYERKMNITTSSDIANLVPLELLYLEDELVGLFHAKFIEQKLYTYDYQARSYRGKGGVIVCLDTSGSMIGEKLDLLKAIVLNIALGALQKKRYFALINFSSITKDILLLPHRPDFKEFFNVLTSSFCGGTNFDFPINRAMDIIENFKYHRESDILIFTDGFGKLGDEALNRLTKYKKQYGFSLFGFLIDESATKNTLAGSCDRTFYLSSSNLLKDILKHFEQLI